MYIHFWFPVASREHGTIVNRGRDVGGTTYFSPFSTCIEKEQRVGERRQHVRSTRNEKDNGSSRNIAGWGVSRERRFRVGGARRRKTDQRSQQEGRGRAVGSAVVGVDHGTRTVRQGRRQGRESGRKREGVGGRPSGRGKL